MGEIAKKTNLQAPLATVTSMDLTAPIDIQAVIGAVKKHEDLLVAIDMLDAGEVLRHAYGIPGVTDSITLGRVENGAVSSMYNGVFIGRTQDGKIVPRTLTVYPIKIEEADEPERYRRTYITEVRGGLYDGGHPFEVWLIAHVLKLASQDLLMVLFTASYDSTKISGSANSDIKYAFNGWGTIVEAEKNASTPTITKAIGNLFETGKLTSANIGDKLLAMWRSRPETFRRKASKIFMATDLVDMYTDWYEAKYTFVAGVGDKESHPLYLRGTSGKCEIVPIYGLPEGSQFVLLTTQQNLCYGFDKESDLKTVKPFNSGNPYWFTMAGKYVFGCQFASIHKSEFCVNDQPLTPVDDEEEEETPTPDASFTAVADPSGKNPTTEGWYESDGAGGFVLSDDTEPGQDVTYYIKS